MNFSFPIFDMLFHMLNVSSLHLFEQNLGIIQKWAQIEMKLFWNLKTKLNHLKQIHKRLRDEMQILSGIK